MADPITLGEDGSLRHQKKAVAVLHSLTDTMMMKKKRMKRRMGWVVAIRFVESVDGTATNSKTP
ncbi:MAG: hypothetical protein QXJ79_05170 [Candidatus Bathyarchaeia archaeon]